MMCSGRGAPAPHALVVDSTSGGGPGGRSMLFMFRPLTGGAARPEGRRVTDAKCIPYCRSAEIVIVHILGFKYCTKIRTVVQASGILH